MTERHDIEAAFQRGLAAHRAGRLAEAEAAYRETLGHAPHRAAAHNLGGILSDQFRFPESEWAYRVCLAVKPDYASALSGLSVPLMRMHRLEEAEAAARRALEIAPDDRVAAYRLGLILLRQGRYAEGWPWYESRSTIDDIPLGGVAFPRWSGEPLQGRSILIWGEQGLGDEIQMARFIPTLRELGASRITVACQTENIRLFEAVGADAAMGRFGRVEFPDHDFWTPMLSLPLHLGVTLEKLTGAPYLAKPERPRKGVGVAWRGNPRNTNDAHRSMPDARLLSLIPGAIELAPAGDMLDSLHMLAGLEAVVTVDTSWVHLAGAAGIPCHLLLSIFGVDWRWRPGEARSPWYDSVHLHWQTTPGDWDAPVRKVVEAVTP